MNRYRLHEPQEREWVEFNCPACVRIHLTDPYAVIPPGECRTCNGTRKVIKGRFKPEWRKRTDEPLQIERIAKATITT